MIDVGGFQILAPSTGDLNISGDQSAGFLAERQVRLDGSGRAMGFVPCFSGRATGNGFAAKGYPLVLQSIDLNEGGYHGGAYFTCPAPGLYHAQLSLILQGTGSGTPTTTYSGYCSIIKNGGLHSFTHSNHNDYWDSISFAAVLKCEVGDTIAFAIDALPGAGPSSTPGMYLDNHNTCTIFYIG